MCFIIICIIIKKFIIMHNRGEGNLEYIAVIIDVKSLYLLHKYAV